MRCLFGFLLWQAADKVSLIFQNGSQVADGIVKGSLCFGHARASMPQLVGEGQLVTMLYAHSNYVWSKLGIVLIQAVSQQLAGYLVTRDFVMFRCPLIGAGKAGFFPVSSPAILGDSLSFAHVKVFTLYLQSQLPGSLLPYDQWRRQWRRWWW